MNTSAPLSSESLLSLLDDSRFKYSVSHHKPLLTVADAQSIRADSESDEGQIKNLFVRNKKGKMWLLTLHENRKLDLKQAAMELGAGRFSFCSAERLMQYLGVIPGAVSPFCLLNDVNHEVSFYIDQALLSHSVIHAHPFDNSMTVSIGTADLLQFLKDHGYDYQVF